MLVQAMQKAGSVSDIAKIREELLNMTYDGLWRIRYDKTGEAVFDFDVIHVKKGGVIETVKYDPTK
jgi:branched-chain amino acid transport system substrate-binding protein